MVFSALLPISKRDVVKGKYLFTCTIELCSGLLMTLAVALRMTVFSDAAVYRSNALMNGNLFALGMAFVGFGLFNLIFVGGFFKTAYKFGRPFVGYIIAVFLTIGIAEALHYIPGFGFLNAFGMEYFAVQLLSMGLGVVFYLAVTLLSYQKACKRFEKIDL